MYLVIFGMYLIYVCQIVIKALITKDPETGNVKVISFEKQQYSKLFLRI